MFLRLLTFLLLMTVSAPVSVFGLVAHRCDTDAKVPVPACCQKAEKAPAAQGGIDQLTHHCDIEVLAFAQQPAATGYKILVDDNHAADVIIPSFASLRLAQSFHKPFSIARHPGFSGIGPPVFLRTCSFLI